MQILFTRYKETIKGLTGNPLPDNPFIYTV